MPNAFLIGILLLALSLRIFGLDLYPIGFTPDEASHGYDAYSLLKTGKDQWGEAWPLSLRSFGDFKLPLYTYVVIPSVAIFGLNEFSTRLPNALFGTFAVLATYLMVGVLFKNKKLQLLSATLLAVSPWHVPLSRGAFEANITTLLIPLGIWAFYKGIEKPKIMPLAVLVFGLNMFSYHSARFITPIIVLALLAWNRKDLKSSVFKKYKWALLTSLVFLGLTIYSLLSGANARGLNIAIFNPTDKWMAVADRRYEATLQGLPDTISRIFSNKITYIFKEFLQGYFSYLSPQFLFTQGAGEWTYGMIPGHGVLYLFELLFIIMATISLTKKSSTSLKFIFLWIIIAPIAASLTKGPGLAANRAAVMMPALQIFSGYGGIALLELLHKKFKSKNLKILFVFLAVISTASFLENYRYHAPINGAQSMLYGRKETFETIKSIEKNYSTIIVSRSLSEPQIYAGFYLKSDPHDYQENSKDWLRYEKEGRSFVDQLGEYSMGKYLFKNIDYHNDKEKESTLLVGKAEEFPSNTKALKEVLYPSGKKAILIVDPAYELYAKSF